ncbi:MAG: nucleotidyltransferase domain-containing protein [Leptospiraceae bacterium]|nr:nucleotidyltransferase domain-containing protein [Leptospiraceae bacterium]
MNSAIIQTVSELKEKYMHKGFIILGVFGSYARNEEKEDSDIDILYVLNSEFKDRGFKKVYKLGLIKESLQQELGKSVDIINRDFLGDIGKRYILKDAIYVK